MLIMEDVCVHMHVHMRVNRGVAQLGKNLTLEGDPWVAQWFSTCLWPRVRSWSPRIESHVGLPVHGACFSLCLCRCLSLCVSHVFLINKNLKKKEKNNPRAKEDQKS